MILSLLVYPDLKNIGLQLHSALTGSYISGTHSIVLINCPNEPTAKDIARAILEKRLAASVIALPKAFSLYFWKGDIEEADAIMLMISTRTSRIPELAEFVRTIHPFDIPELVSLPLDQGNPVYFKWLEDVVPED
ncbi:protein CutA homolog isoform X2 [Protopterus annectens]|nr:protein CutA homolog isoform X2 [Protopterus annectens]